jgi:hypothetical protein
MSLFRNGCALLATWLGRALERKVHAADHRHRSLALQAGRSSFVVMERMISAVVPSQAAEYSYAQDVLMPV